MGYIDKYVKLKKEDFQVWIRCSYKENLVKGINTMLGQKLRLC